MSTSWTGSWTRPFSRKCRTIGARSRPVASARSSATRTPTGLIWRRACSFSNSPVTHNGCSRGSNRAKNVAFSTSCYRTALGRMAKWSPLSANLLICLRKRRLTQAVLEAARRLDRRKVRFGWGGRIRTSAWGNQNPLPYHLATPQSCLESGGTGSPTDSFWQRRSIEGVEPFQPARAPFPVESDAEDDRRIMRQFGPACRVVLARKCPPLARSRRPFPAIGELREGRFRGKTAVRCSNPYARHPHDLSRADQRYAAGPQSRRGPAGRRASGPLWRFRQRHRRRRAGGSRTLCL